MMLHLPMKRRYKYSMSPADERKPSRSFGVLSGDPQINAAYFINTTHSDRLMRGIVMILTGGGYCNIWELASGSAPAPNIVVYKCLIIASVISRVPTHDALSCRVRSRVRKPAFRVFCIAVSIASASRYKLNE